MKTFKFLQTDKDIPTPQDIRNSPWLRSAYLKGWNDGMMGITEFPQGYRPSQRTINTWYMGQNDARRGNQTII